MITRAGITLLIFGIGLIVFSAFLWRQLNHYKSEFHRTRDNFASIIEDKNRQLSVTKEEMTSIIDADSSLIAMLRDSLQLKDKRIAHLVQGSMQSTTRIKTVLKDTIIYRPMPHAPGSMPHALRPMPAQYFVFRDPWTEAFGVLYPDSVELDYTSYDTLVTVTSMYKEAKWFLPRWFEKWKLRTDFENTNPHNQYQVIKSVERKN